VAIHWRAAARIVQRFFWVVSLLASIAGAFVGYLTVATASGAPQEAAGAALACLIVIAPYAFARGIEGLLHD